MLVMRKILLIIVTRKGAFIAASDEGRRGRALGSPLQLATADLLGGGGDG